VDYLDVSDDDIIVTEEDMRQGMPSPPREIIELESSLRLGKADLKGLSNKDDLKEEACKTFMTDDSFVQTPAFKEFSWRTRRDEYVDNVAKKRSLHLELPEAVIQAEVRKEMKE